MCVSPKAFKGSFDRSLLAIAMANLTCARLTADNRGISAKNDSKASPGLDSTRAAQTVRNCPKLSESGIFPSGLISLPPVSFRDSLLSSDRTLRGFIISCAFAMRHINRELIQYEIILYTHKVIKSKINGCIEKCAGSGVRIFLIENLVSILG